MKKSYTLQYIDSPNSVNKKYLNIVSPFFNKVQVTSDLYDTFDFFHHYKPDIIIVALSTLCSDYEPFLKKVKKNYSTPIIILIEPSEVINISSALNYNFNYAILDKKYECNIKQSIKEALLKVSLIDKLLVGYNQKFSTLEKNKAVIENSEIPTLITNGQVGGVKCNGAFSKMFHLKQEHLTQELNSNTFIDSKALKTILKTNDFTQEQSLEIKGNSYACKIYVLQKYELYLITFDCLLKGNQLIDMSLKNDLGIMLERIDKNFDDYVRLQYSMIELSSQIRSFLNVDTKKSAINEWLISNKKLVETLEKEFDSNILEELKLNLYINK